MILKGIITKKDVKNSSYYNNENCSLAKALKRIPELKGKDIKVGGHSFDIEDKDFEMDDLKFSTNGVSEFTNLSTIIQQNYKLEEPLEIKFSFNYE